MVEMTKTANKGTEPATAATGEAAKKSAKKKKGGCLKGCLLFLLVLLVLLGALAALAYRLPQKWGLWGGNGEKYTQNTPDPIAEEEIVAEAVSKGFKPEGVQVFVFPAPESADAILLASFDFSKGAQNSDFGGYNPAVAALVLLGGGEKAMEHGITHVGAEFLDEEGNRLLVIAASIEDVRALASGQITEEEFTKRLGKQIDYPNYVRRAVIPF